jgi:hypothetical protein
LFFLQQKLELMKSQALVTVLSAALTPQGEAELEYREIMWNLEPVD